MVNKIKIELRRDDLGPKFTLCSPDDLLTIMLYHHAMRKPDLLIPANRSREQENLQTFAELFIWLSTRETVPPKGQLSGAFRTSKNPNNKRTPENPDGKGSIVYDLVFIVSGPRVDRHVPVGTLVLPTVAAVAVDDTKDKD